ncbi:DUF6940 family protein [endosymbiont GvMRE of Glomus versiforme]|uniref:DUF6940 family protein n=1 Tax=endosymbiont GvMRE of Glomus versiforme TaxID=2039283 RepID=UPI000ED4AB91|nr:hypothetical protein [endosymbiont GvMRE of Glomus versiforme]RHZ35930.1 hypothetical protein GvMRE_Ic4g115 [endosymbiont GvMRE of Glomus versiforme]
MVYTIIKNRVSRDIIKYRFAKSDNNKLTYAEFIQLLSNKDKEFIKEFDSQLRQVPTELSSRSTAYFWECVPVSEDTTNREFEFVVVKAEVLDNITCDYSSFVEHFNRSQDNHVVSFPSLSGDTLIVPIPINDYKNLKEFNNNASLEQKEHFWQKVGEKMKESLLNANGAPRWLSTSGLGVSYLHVRIDSRPKYYSFDEYRQFWNQSQQANTQRQQFWQLPWWQKKD